MCCWHSCRRFAGRRCRSGASPGRLAAGHVSNALRARRSRALFRDGDWRSDVVRNRALQARRSRAHPRCAFRRRMAAADFRWFEPPFCYGDRYRAYCRGVLERRITAASPQRLGASQAPVYAFLAEVCERRAAQSSLVQHPVYEAPGWTCWRDLETWHARTQCVQGCAYCMRWAGVRFEGEDGGAWRAPNRCYAEASRGGPAT